MKKMMKSALSILLAALMAMPGALAYAAEAEPVATVAEDANVVDVAYATFTGDSAKVSKMSAVMDYGSTPIVTTREGRTGWALSTLQDDRGGTYTTETNATINIDLDGGFAYDIQDGSTYIVEVDYYDEKGGVFSLVYDGQTQSDRYHSYVLTTPGGKGEEKQIKGSWRTATFRIQDGKFANRLDASDLKVSANILNNNHSVKAGMETPFGTKYSTFYPNRYGRISTYNDVVVAEVRVKKLATINPFTAKITTAEKGNKFYEDEAITFNVELTNNTKEAYTLNSHHKAVEQHEKGVVIDRAGETYTIGAGETKTLTVVEPESPFGIFDYEMTLTTADGKVETKLNTEYSRNKIATIQNPQAGTNVHLEGSDSYHNDYEAIFEAGKNAGYISFRDSMRWPSFEKSPGLYEKRSTFIPAMEMCEEYGIEWFPIINANKPSFMANPNEPVRTDEEAKSWADFVKWITKWITEGGATAMEAHNEWNLAFPAGTPEEYALYIKATREAAQSVNPNMKMIGVDTALFDAAYIRRLFEAGALDYMDGISYHPYDWTKPVEKGSQFANVKAARDLMTEFGGGDKEIWLTETGWDPTLAHGGDAGWIITDHDKGYYIARALLQNNAGQYFDRIYFYEFANSGMEVSYGEARYGTMHSVYEDLPYAAEPAYTSVCATNWLLGGAEFQETIDHKAADVFTGPYIYRWTRPNTDGLGDQFVGLWTANVRETVAIDLGVDEATLIDMYGNQQTMKAHNGVFNIMLSEEPQYLVGNFTKFERANATITPSLLIGAATTNDTLDVEIDIPGVNSGSIVMTNGMFEVVENRGLVDGKASIRVKSPALPFTNHTVRFDVLDDAGHVLYNANVHVNNVDTITMAESHKLSDVSNLNRWQMQIDLTNNKNVETISGEIVISAPDEITKYIQHIKIAELGPKQTMTYKMFMPELVTKEMRDYKAMATLNTGEVFEEEHKMFFTSVPYATNKPVIDGEASRGEYNDNAWFPIKGEVGKTVELLYGLGVFNGDDDLRGNSTILWDEDNLYFFIEVTDNVFVNNQEPGINIWNGDSIQIGIADQGKTGAGGYCELTVALTSEGPSMFRHLANNADKPTGVVENVEMAIVRDGTKTRYELAIPWEECLNQGINEVGPGYQPRFAFLINEDDGLGRNSYMEYSQRLGAIGTEKNAGWFSDMTLADK